MSEKRDFARYKNTILALKKDGCSYKEIAKMICEKGGWEYCNYARQSVKRLVDRHGKKKEIVKEVIPKKEIKTSNKRVWNENIDKRTASLEQQISNEPKTLADVIEQCEIDENVWEIKSWTCSSSDVSSKYRDQNLKWTSDGVMTGHAIRKNEWVTHTNYHIKVFLEKKEADFNERLGAMLPLINEYVPKKLNIIPGNKKECVVSFTDFHIGADVKNLIKTQDFNVAILLDYLDRAVRIINDKKYSKVHVNMLGDFFESISGMNHENVFKSLGTDMWGANVMIWANEIIGGALLSQINNLASINMIGGNHDRISPSKKLEDTSEGAKVLWYMLQKDFPHIGIDFHYSLISKEIDGIQYLLSHGDKGYSKKEFSKVILDYGDQELYNLYIEGHKHTREAQKSWSLEKKYYKEEQVVSFEGNNYRKIVSPPLFTGNWYSEGLGFGGSAGFILCENNGEGLPNVTDFSL